MIRCPYDPKHCMPIDALAKHLKRCKARPDTMSLAQQAESVTEDPLINETVRRIVKQVSKIDDQGLLNHLFDDAGIHIISKKASKSLYKTKDEVVADFKAFN